MRFNLVLLFVLLFLALGDAWGKGGGAHGQDQMRAGGFSGPLHQVKGFANDALDTRPGDIKGTLSKVGYGKSAQEASLAGLLKKEGIVVPKTHHFNVAKGSSHRISTHESFFEGFSKRYLEAAKVANPNIPEDVLRKKIDNAFKTMKETLVMQYKDYYKVHSELAEKLAHQDILIHFWGDYTTSNTIGLPDIEALKKEFLKTVDGLWTSKQIKEFDNVVSNLVGARASMNVIAEKALSLTIQNGETVNKAIMNANGGKNVFKNLSQNKLQGMIRNVRWRLEAEVRQKALKFLDINKLTPQELYALDAIGPNPKAGKAGGKLFFSTLDENGLLEKYFKDGLGKEDLEKIAKSMDAKGCKKSQIDYFVNHPDVKGGCSGQDAIKRKAPTLKKAKKLDAYAKKLIKLKSFTNVIVRGGKVLPSISFVSEGIDIDTATWSKRGKRIFKVGNLRIAKGGRNIVFIEGKTLAEAKKNAGNVVKKLNAAKMAKGTRVIAVSTKTLKTLKFLGRFAGNSMAVLDFVDAIEPTKDLIDASRGTFKDPLAQKTSGIQIAKNITTGGASLGGGALGAWIGGTVGTFIFPGIGTAIGSTIGGIIGGIASHSVADRVAGKTADYFIQKLTDEKSRQKNTYYETYRQRALLNQRMKLLLH